MEFGIDISGWQAGINLEQAKAEGVKFAILRGGYTGWGTGIDKYKDTSFETFYNQCKSLNIPVGAYWYSCANNYEKGVNEAKFMYENCLKNKQFEYPIYIDVEDTHHQSKTKNGTTEAIIGFCETLEDLGYYVGIYANVDWFKNYIDTDRLNAYDKWVACWSTNRPTYPNGEMWQFGGDTNKIRNKIIAGMVCDQDYSYMDYPNLIKSKGFNGYKKEDNPTNNNPQPEPQELKVGTRVKAIAQGNGASDGSCNTAKSGVIGTITRIIPNAKYPYLISDNEPIGWYKKDSLEII